MNFCVCNTWTVLGTTTKWDPCLFYRLCITFLYRDIQKFIYIIYPLYADISRVIIFSIWSFSFSYQISPLTIQSSGLNIVLPYVYFLMQTSIKGKNTGNLRMRWYSPRKGQMVPKGRVRNCKDILLTSLLQ